jgi:hypothetical protein
MTTTRIFALLLVVSAALLSCDKEKDPKSFPPTAPNLLSAVEVTYNTVRLTWNDRSSDEEGFEIEMQTSIEWELVGSVAPGVVGFTVEDLTPNTLYHFRVFAYNNAGRSEASNDAEATTEAFDPPNAPTNVTASPLAPTVVQVHWADTSPQPVEFVIDRRSVATDWTRVGIVGDNIVEYNDSTCTAATTYYYRVGATANNLLTLSADSAEVTTPQVGTPLAPSDLTATVQLGFGVQLHWTDNSLDETEFHIRRNVEGQFFEIIDTVTANTVDYADSLGDQVADYNYQVRASNSFGSSGWSNIASAAYKYCSDGAVPICLENFWEYEVSPSGAETYEVRRQIRRADNLGGVYYYLMVEFRGDETDTLFYWRNFDNGLYQEGYPANSTPELLLRIPPTTGIFWNFEGDSVIVTTPSVTVTVQGTTYTGVTIYQRFSRTSNASIKYYLKPETMGIIKEEEYLNSSLQVTRELTGWLIRN